MVTKAATPLQQIAPDDIRKNPENPRLIFLEEEMNDLLNSIEEVGIRVPLSVYDNGRHYVLLDGERRWRCAKRLNLAAVPAIVQPKPTKLENLLMMFNIHNVRVDWDLMPMALKLGDIRQMLDDEGQDTSAKALAAVTGVRLPTVRRAMELLELPQRYQRLLLREAEKPRNERRIKADLFIEIYKSYNAIAKHSPDVLEEVGKTEYVDAMVRKYQSGVVDNVVAFRDVSKIARAELAGADKVAASETLVRLTHDAAFSIEEAYQETVESAYLQRDIATRTKGLIERLGGLRSGRKMTPGLRSALRSLRVEIDRLVDRE